jgi:hypothetical protein
VLGHWHLHEDAMNSRIIVQSMHKRDEVGFRNVFRKFVLKRSHTNFSGLFGFVRDINLASGVVADDDYSEARRDAVFSLEALNVSSDPLAQVFGEGFAIDDFCGHFSLNLIE